MQDSVIGFIGAGNMASSLIQGLLDKGHGADRLMAADIDTDKLRALARRTGIRVGSNSEIALEATVIVLAVKPQVMQTVCQSLSIGPQQPLVVSVAAGVTLSQLGKWLDQEPAIVRCMPNTPALIGKGASALFANDRVTSQQRQVAQELLASVGLSVWVETESELDLVTAISGSGPAYFFLFMEAMQEAAQNLGMDAGLARALVLQTASGAAELAQAQDVDVDVAELRRRVTSPGGTTEQALKTFEAGELKTLVQKAVTAARDRSVALAAESDES